MTGCGLWSDEANAFVETGFSSVEAAAQRLTDYAWTDRDNPTELTIGAVCSEHSTTNQTLSAGEEDQ